ncbi:unnamed protein product, partial [Meganyctiphanes norvegica]
MKNLFENRISHRIVNKGFSSVYLPTKKTNIWSHNAPGTTAEPHKHNFILSDLNVRHLVSILLTGVCFRVAYFVLDNHLLRHIPRESIIVDYFRDLYLSDYCSDRIIVMQVGKHVKMTIITIYRWITRKGQRSRPPEPSYLATKTTNREELVRRNIRMVSFTNSNQSLLTEAYDNYTAIYLLLLERLKQHRSSLQGDKQTSLDQSTQRRRPSSVAEAAMRKMCITIPSGKSSPPVLVHQQAVTRTVQEVFLAKQPSYGGRMLPMVPGECNTSIDYNQVLRGSTNLINRGIIGGMSEAESATVTTTSTSNVMAHVTPPFREHSQDSTDISSYIPVSSVILPSGVTLPYALVGKSYRESETGASTSIDEGVEADIGDSVGSLVSRSSHYGLQNLKSMSQQSSELSHFTDSPLGSITSTESTFESFESQLEPDFSTSFSSCSQASITQRPVISSGTPQTSQPQANLEPPADLPDRANTRSPVNFREGRRASDGLVNQGVIAFRQRLIETEKAKGFTELNSVHQEHQALTSLYQAMPPSVTTSEEVAVRQHQPQYQQQQQYANYVPQWRHSYTGSDELSRAPLVRQRVSLPDALSLTSPHKLFVSKDLHKDSECTATKPLQQQLFQHRLQQKRQILQKQAAFPRQSYPGGCELSRRQMVRQASYKLAQQQPVLPPLPVDITTPHLLSSIQTELTCPIIEEHEGAVDQAEEGKGATGWRHLPWNSDPTTAATWHNLPTSLAACQISDTMHKPQQQQPLHGDTRQWSSGLSSWNATWHQISTDPT